MTRKDLTSETAPDTYDVEAEARRRGIEPYQVRAAGAVNDRLVRDLVSDFRAPISQSASMIPTRSSEPPPTKGSGWVEAAPLKSPDTRWIDAQIDAADRRDRAIRLQQEIELAEIESRLARRNRHDE